MIFLQIFLAGLVLWIMFMAVMNVRVHLEHDHWPVIDAGIHLFSFVFYVLDVTLNLIYGSILFLDLPRELTLTARIKRIMSTYPVYSKRYRLAFFIRRKAIEPSDKDHFK